MKNVTDIKERALEKAYAAYSSVILNRPNDWQIRDAIRAAIEAHKAEENTGNHISNALNNIENRMKAGLSLNEVEEALKQHIRRQSMKIWYDIIDERQEQNKKWGGASHDDQHSLVDWQQYIRYHTGKAIAGKNARYQMIRVAALAVAAIEAIDRKK